MHDLIVKLFIYFNAILAHVSAEVEQLAFAIKAMVI